MSVYTRVVHMHESKHYILRPLWDGEHDVPPSLSWWGRGVEAFDDEGTVEGGPATTEETAGLLDERLHPGWAQRLCDGATLDACRLGKRPQTFPDGVARSAVAGIAANIAPSKSVSMLMVAGDKAVANFVTATHRDAVTAALNFLQDYGDIARAQSDLHGLVGVLDQRYTSKVGNPHLSTTATIINCAPRRDGKWVAPDTREILRWMYPVATYVDAYMLRALSTYPELKASVTIGEGLPSINSDAVDEGTCQRYSSDSDTRRPLPASRGLASAVYSVRPANTDVTLQELRRRTQLDTEPVTLGEPQALPEWTEAHLNTALDHAVDRLTNHLTKRRTVSTHYLISSALTGLTLAGPVGSALHRDVRLLVPLLAQHHAFRDRVHLSERFTGEERDSVAPGFR